MNSSILIRPEREADLDSVYGVNTAAFNTPAEAYLVNQLRGAVSPLVSLVAEISSDIIVGHVLFSPVTLDDHPGLFLMGLGPVAVLPEHQRRGIGSALIENGLDACRSLGCGAVVVLGHPDYYPRFGFQPASRFGLQAVRDVPDEVFLARELLPGYLDLASGVIRYHPLFDHV